jgi:hypothetical protein
MADTGTVPDDSEKDSLAQSDVGNEPQSSDNWKYSAETNVDPSQDKVDNSFTDINWSASEFIAHDKNISWYIILSLITLFFAAIVYLLTHDKISTAVIVFAGGITGFYAARKPRLLNYKIDTTGLTIQSKVFSYDSFKSFAIAEDSAIPNVILIPLKRFMPTLSVYLDPSSEEAVLKVLSKRIPQDVHHQALIERFMQRVRF